MKAYYQKVEAIQDELRQIAQDLYDHPETTDQEVYACELLANYLQQKGFDITLNAAGHHTAFIAQYDTKVPGPHVVITAEYDALAGIGHACGHNLIAAMSVGSGVVLKDIIPKGIISIYGTPGEEGGTNGSSKASFVQAGLLANVDFSCSIHPAADTHATGNYIACRTLELEFFGQPAHASSCPQYGANALDAMINFYNQINALRQQTIDNARIHGIITHGGDAPNIIPEYTKAIFYVRANKKQDAQHLVDQFKVIAQASASGAFCRTQVSEPNHAVDNMVINNKLDQLFVEAFTELGENVVDQTGSCGSTDVGNISHVVPTAHPTVKICASHLNPHTQEFAQATVAPPATQGLLNGTKAIVDVVYRVVNDPVLLEAVKADFAQAITDEH